MQSRFDRAKGKKGYIDRATTRTVIFTDIMKEAKASEKIGDYKGAARIYSEVSESIVHNLPWVYVGSGRFYNLARRCLENIALCAKKARRADERGAILWYVLRGWAMRPGAIADGYYEDALKLGASGQDDYRLMVKMLDDGIPVAYNVEHRGDVKEHLEIMRKTVARHVRG